jgi:outer membrane protein TolC
LALAAPFARADERAVELTVEDAILRAERHSALLASNRKHGDASRAAVSEAESVRQPRVDLGAAYSRLSEVPELVITGPEFELRSIFPNIENRYGVRLSFSVPLYAGGGIEAGVDSAREGVRAAEADTETRRADVRLEATRAFWTLVTAREAARVLEDAMASFERHLADARNRVDLGLAARNELLAVQVERDRAELALVRATFASARAEADLARLCGFDPGTAIRPAEIAVPAAPDEEPVEMLVERALASRSERAALASRRAAVLAQARAERAGKKPAVNADGGIDWSNPNLRVLPLEEEWNETWDVSVRFRWTLWDGRGATRAEARAVAEAEALALQLEDLDRRILLEVTSRALDVREAARALPVADRAVEAAAESERIARDRYREGLLPSAELLDAERARLEAGLDRTEAAARLAVARAFLERAVAGAAR